MHVVAARSSGKGAAAAEVGAVRRVGYLSHMLHGRGLAYWPTFDLIMGLPFESKFGFAQVLDESATNRVVYIVHS